MGLFDRRDERKKGDDFDSPVETIDLNAPPPDPEPAASEPAPAAAAAEPDEPEPTTDYGIEQAIQLMRTLPPDNVELVVQVVKQTLESTRIKLPAIIEDASQKQSDIEGRIKVLREEIGDLEKEIETRRTEIESLETDYEETTTVKERLVLAEKIGKGGATKDGAQASGKTPEAPRPKRPTEPPPPPKEGKPAEPAAKK